jgi:hypothetical protein
MIQRRQEVMASEIIRTGKVTIAGELYPTVVVDFGRDAALTVALEGAAKWDQEGVSLLDGLDTWAALIHDKSGATATDVIMGTDIWKLFKTDAEVVKLLERFNRSTTLTEARPARTGATYQGNVNGYDVYVYSGSYVDEAGSAQPLWPNGTVAMAAPEQLEGVRAFGAIRDERAGYQALPYFPTSWLENDPPVRFLMTQSAPLLVPYRANASMAATVL